MDLKSTIIIIHAWTDVSSRCESLKGMSSLRSLIPCMYIYIIVNNSYRICWSIHTSYCTYSCCFHQECVLYSKYHVLISIILCTLLYYTDMEIKFYAVCFRVRVWPTLRFDLYSSKYGLWHYTIMWLYNMWLYIMWLSWLYTLHV